VTLARHASVLDLASGSRLGSIMRPAAVVTVHVTSYVAQPGLP
jgi:hypothetical protein